MHRHRPPLIVLGRTLLVALGLLLTLSSLAGAQPRDAGGDVLYLTDTEGRLDNLNGVLKARGLKMVRGRLEFTDKSSQLVFGGDLTDRGAASIRLVRMLTDLKERHPDRVSLIWGNRDVNKLAMPRDLAAMARTIDADYSKWLVDKLEAEAKESGKTLRLPRAGARLSKALAPHNTIENRVDYWLASHSAPGALENHRKELELLQGHKVSARDAARDYVAQVMPGGEYFRYLSKGQLMAIRGGAVYVHGGITDENYGRVPGATRRILDPHAWAKALNEWGTSQLAAWEQVARAGAHSKLPQKLVSYGDAIWDPTVVDPVTGRKGAVIMNDMSVIYPFRQKEAGNLRMASDKTIGYLKRYGITTMVVGHTPAGHVPVLLRRPGFLLMMGDTSFGSRGDETYIKIGRKGGVQVRGRTADGTLVSQSVSVNSTSPVGHLTSDGYTVLGKTKAGKYLLYKYYGGYQIDEKQVSAAELKKLNPRPPVIKDDQERGKHVELLRKNLAVKGVRTHTIENVAAMVKGKKVFIESGASKFGQFPVSPAAMKKQIESFYGKYNPRDIVIVTGGTDNGVEKMVHEYAVKRGIQVIGFVQEGAVPQEINLVKDLVITGRMNEWGDPLKASINLAKVVDGEVIFRGGGGVVGEGIEVAAKLGVRFHLMDGKGGASADAAKKYPDRAFRTVTQLFRSTNASQQANGLRLEARNQTRRIATTERSAASKPLRVGIYTGSFDPPHAGHKAIVDGMKAKFGLDVVYVVADRSTAYKPGMMSIEHREAMVAEMFKETPGVQILTPDMVKQLGAGEMWDVTRVVAARHPNAKLFNLMGTDTLSWYRTVADKFAKFDLTLLVNRRDRTMKIPRTAGGKKVEAADLQLGDISSTKVREALAAGKTHPSLPPAVHRYIVKKGLYGVEKGQNRGIARLRSRAQQRRDSRSATSQRQVHATSPTKPPRKSASSARVSARR